MFEASPLIAQMSWPRTKTQESTNQGRKVYLLWDGDGLTNHLFYSAALHTLCFLVQSNVRK